MRDYFRQFGGPVSWDHINRYEQSDHWIKGKFRNLERTRIAVPWTKVPSMLYKQVAYRKDREPRKKLPIIPFDTESVFSSEQRMRFIWYGHSVIFIRVHGKNILIDPMFGPNTTPIAPVATERFSESSLDIIDQLPLIDLVLITHDHYDHLDMASIDKIKSKVKNFYVALGIGRHLVEWGVEESQIREFDWWDTLTWSGIDITFTPTRHFSGRGIRDRQMSLWGGWVLNNGLENIWISGDGGYGSHFKTIGERLGPFDLAFMECGQYNSDWHEMHLFPYESIKGAIDAGVKKAIPVHWGAFSLSYQHTWYEPVEFFILAAHEQGIPFSSPPLGKVFSLDDEETDQWWLEYI